MAWMKKNWLGTIEELVLIERYFGTDDPEELVARYDSSIAVLESGDVEAWLADAASAGITEGAASHFRADWMEGATLPGVDSETLESTFRDGFLAALTAARELVLPVSALWVMIGDEGSFAVDHIAGANAVTVVISIPRGTTGAESAE